MIIINCFILLEFLNFLIHIIIVSSLSILHHNNSLLLSFIIGNLLLSCWRIYLPSVIIIICTNNDIINITKLMGSFQYKSRPGQEREGKSYTLYSEISHQTPNKTLIIIHLLKDRYYIASFMLFLCYLYATYLLYYWCFIIFDSLIM